MPTIRQLNDLGQSMWLDTIDRRLLVGDGLVQLIHLGIGGVTSNPTIFQQALTASAIYDEAIRDMLQKDPNIEVESIYEQLTVHDIQMAADRLHLTYTQSAGLDGYVSLEVSPHLAYDTEGALQAARHLWQAVNRPNLMIKVPATLAGLPVMEQLIAEGINVNATLLFSVERYEAVARAYLQGLARCPDPGHIASVASFFVSRIDSKLDPVLENLGNPEALALRGRIAIAQARLAYQCYKEVMQYSLARMPGKHRPQRLLWASTGVKNPHYSDVLYIDNLIGPDTVTTVPQDTLDAFTYHGTIRSSLEDEIDPARRDLISLNNLGVDIEAIAQQLEEEGVAKFVASYEAGLKTLNEKRFAVTQA